MSKKAKKYIKPVRKSKLEDIDEATGLTEKQKRFCLEWIHDCNAARAYMVAYPGVTEDSAKAAGCRLLTNVYIRPYINYLNDNLAEVMGLTKKRMLAEHMKLAFTDMSSFHDTLVTRKEFETLSADQRACISEISTQVKKAVIAKGTDEQEIVDVEFIKIKTWDKHKSIDGLTKLLGHEVVQKMVLQSTNLNANMEVEPSPDEAAKIREALNKSI